MKGLHVRDPQSPEKILLAEAERSTVVHGATTASLWKGEFMPMGSSFLVGTANQTGQGSLFGPYTPLQQLDMLADYGTKSYIVGSTNSLLLQQKDRYSDILVNVSKSHMTLNLSALIVDYSSTKATSI